MYDLETRADKSQKNIIGNVEANPLEDTLCCIVYRDYESDEIQKKRFIGYYDDENNYISSCALFKEFLDEQASKNKICVYEIPERVVRAPRTVWAMGSEKQLHKA